MTNKTPTQQQLQDALEAIEAQRGNMNPTSFMLSIMQHYNAIKFALRFTAKALGEPTNDMRKAVRDVAKNWDDEAEAIIFGSDVTFKAMIQQLCAEVADE